jgi:hypothetical protein
MRLGENVRMQRPWRLAVIVGGTIAWSAVLLIAEGGIQYPLAKTFSAQVKVSDETTVTSQVRVKVDNAMLESRRVRATDALQHGGYANFVNVLRTLPPVGTIALPKREVQIRYARETTDQGVTRLVLIADRPLVFLKTEEEKPRAGYELTLMELRIDAKGGVIGATMTGAARVKPSPDGGVILDEYAEAPITLTPKANPS